MSTRNIFIIDWDNTLFPTTWCLRNNIDLNNIETRNRYIAFFYELDNILYKLLQKLLNNGKVFIVTNALSKWVEISSLVMPNSVYLLQKTTLISARKRYEDYTPDMSEWKKYTFRDILDGEYRAGQTLNMISIGDAEHEYKALVSLYGSAKGNQQLLKSVKFLEDPSYYTLIDELDVVYNSIENIILSKQCLDLNFKIYNNAYDRASRIDIF